MRIIIWGINYAPETTGIANYTADLADFLHSRGDAVEVIAGFPYYPAWAKAPGDRRRLFRRDRVGAVWVHRCWQYVPRRPTAWRRILHEASFVLTSLWRALRLPRGDLYVVVSPPLGLGPAAWLVTWVKGSRYLFHVQDLQPDAAAGTGLLRAGFLLRLLRKIESVAYRRATGVAGISAGMVKAIAAKGVAPEKIFLLPNWLRGPRMDSPEVPGGWFRRSLGISAATLVAVYSGNLGRKQGLQVLVETAGLLAAEPPAGRPVLLIIVGDGAEQAELAARLRLRPLANLRLLPLLPEAEYRAMLREADLALITQLPGTGHVCFPSKLLSVLAAGLPVITAADSASDLAGAVRDGGFGVNVPAGDAGALADVLREAAQRPDRLAAWAARSRWVEQFSPGPMLEKFAQVLPRLARVRDGAPGEVTSLSDGLTLR